MDGGLGGLSLVRQVFDALLEAKTRIERSLEAAQSARPYMWLGHRSRSRVPV